MLSNSLLYRLVTIALIAPILCKLCAQQPDIANAEKLDVSRETVAQLIDDLRNIDSAAPGIDGGALYGGFIVDGKIGEFQVGVLGLAPPTIPLAMRELVRRGPTALPQLLQHLNDKTPTMLVVGNINDGSPRQVGLNEFDFEYFSDEYDPRQRSHRRKKHVPYMWKDFDGSYTIKVGDVCFALIGQIVNRRLIAVRYQPSAGLVVNSPIEAPQELQRVKSDWGVGSPELLKASLMLDVRGDNRPPRMTKYFYRTYVVYPALQRLKLYFPDTYSEVKLTKPELIRTFEQTE